jgi:hypothetical protein
MHKELFDYKPEKNCDMEESMRFGMRGKGVT